MPTLALSHQTIALLQHAAKVAAPDFLNPRCDPATALALSELEGPDRSGIERELRRDLDGMTRTAANTRTLALTLDESLALRECLSWVLDDLGTVDAEGDDDATATLNTLEDIRTKLNTPL